MFCSKGQSINCVTLIEEEGRVSFSVALCVKYKTYSRSVNDSVTLITNKLYLAIFGKGDSILINTFKKKNPLSIARVRDLCVHDASFLAHAYSLILASHKDEEN